MRSHFLILASLSVLVIPTQSYALSLRSFLRTKSIKVVRAEDKFPNCTDFSGDWRGECSDGFGSVSEILKVDQQDCTRLTMTFSGDYFVDFIIGGNKREGSSAYSRNMEPNTFDNTYSTLWNTSRTRLLVHGSLSFHGFDTGVYTRGIWDEEIFFNQEMLVIESKNEFTDIVNGVPVVRHDSEVCTFEKMKP